MKNCWRLAISTLLVLTCWTANSWAETRYISDQLVVSLREQPKNNAELITYLKTDMSVEVIEEAGDYIKVKTKAGEIGYIKQHYLTDKTPKTTIIKRLQRERDQLADKAGAMKQQVASATSQGDKAQQELATQLAEASKQVTDLQNKLNKSQAELQQTSKSYQTLQSDAKNVVAITKERDQLRETNQELNAVVTELEEEVKDLTMTGAIKWFLAGGGILFFGWLIGKMSGSSRRRGSMFQ